MPYTSDSIEYGRGRYAEAEAEGNQARVRVRDGRWSGREGKSLANSQRSGGLAARASLQKSSLRELEVRAPLLSSPHQMTSALPAGREGGGVRYSVLGGIPISVPRKSAQVTEPAAPDKAHGVLGEGARLAAGTCLSYLSG